MANEIKYKVGFDVNHSDLNKLKSSLQQLQKLSISDIMKINDSDRSSAITALNDIKRQATNVQEALKTAFNAKLNTVNIETFNKSLQKSNTSIEQIYSTFSKGGVAGENAFRSLTSQVLTTNIQLKETHSLLDNIATTLSNTVKWNLASSAVNTMSQSIQQAWGYVKNLDTSLNDIRIVTNKSAEQMANFAVQANQAAQTLGRTTTDYTKAALIYAQQGLSDEEIAERTAVTLKTANVTGQSTAEVSEQLTAVWNGYKVSAEQAEVYVDRLAAVAATTASDLQELSTGMSKVASAAAAMGVGEDQLAAQLSTIISVTRQAPESVGTALRTIYARITDIKAGIAEDEVDLGRYSGKMAALGFNVLDATGNLRDMGQVIEEIGYKWQDLTREQQVSLAQTMAGQRQYSNLIALFDNFDKYTEALNTAQNAAGTLEQQQGIYLESTAAHLNQLKTATENLYDSLLNPDSLEPLIDGFADLLSFAAQFVDSLGGGGAVLTSLGAIGVSVFSEQIAKGINTTLTNLDIAKENARQFEMTLEQVQTWQGIPGLDQTQRDLLASREQMLSLVNVMSPDQFTAMQATLNDIIEATNKVASLTAQQDILDGMVQAVTKATDKWQGLKDLMMDSAGQEELIKRLEKQNLEFNQLSQSVKNYQHILQSIQGNANLSDDDFAIRVQQLKSNLIDYQTQLQTLVDEGKLEIHKQQVERLGQELATLDDKVPAEEVANKLNLIASQIIALTKNAGESGNELAERLKQNFAGAANSLTNLTEQAKKVKKAKEDIFNSQTDNAQRTAYIQGLTKIVGGLSQTGAAINQIQHLGSIFKNSQISDSQKALSLLTNGLPSLIMGIKGVTSAASAMGAALGVASGGITVVLGLLAAGATAFSLYTQAQQQAREETIKINNAIIEEEKNRQSQIENSQELLIKINDLVSQGELSRSQLRAEIEKLTKEYDVEEDYIQKLIGNYDNLTESIKQTRIEREKQRLESLRTEYASAKSNILSIADDTKQGKKYHGGIDYRLDFQSGYTHNFTSGDQKLYQQLISGGFNKEGKKLFTVVDYSRDAILQLYDSLNAQINEANLTAEQKISSQLYKNIQSWLNSMANTVEEYRTSQRQLFESQLKLGIYNSENSNFEKIDTGEEYLKQRNQLIAQLWKLNGASYEEATQLVDNYLSISYNKLYNQFNNAANYINEYRKKFGVNSKVEEQLLKLDSAHLDQLKQLELSTGAVNSWEDLANIIQRIANIDLSNLNLINDETTVEAAADNYNFYQSLEDQVRSGKSISKTTFKDLQPELQQFFSIMANGSYKMTEDAEKFYEKIDSLKLQGFFDSIVSINKEIEKNQSLSSLSAQSFNYDNINKVAVTQGEDFAGFTADQDLLDKQLQYLSIVGETNAELKQQVEIWYNNREAVGLHYQEVLAIAKAVEEVGDQTEGWTDQTAELNEALKQAEQRLYDAMFPTDADVDQSTLAQLSNTLQELSPQSEQLADTLYEDARAADHLAQAILRFDDAVQDVVDHYDTWIAALQNGSIQEQAEIVGELRDAYADLLDLDGSTLSTDFLTNVQNLNLMKTAIDGDIEAYNQLRQLATKDLILSLGLDLEKFKSDRDIIYNLVEQLLNQDFGTLKIGADLNNEAILQSLSDIVNAAELTAKEASNYLASMGIDAEVIEQKTETEQTQRQTGFNANFSPSRASFSAPVINGGRITTYDGQYVAQNLDYTPITQTVTTTKENSAFALKVTSAHKSSGGNFKFTHSSRGGGSAGVKRRTEAAEKAAKAAKTSTPKPDTSTKETKDYAKDDRDIYHDINIEISEINRELERTQKIQERLFGKQLIANLNKQSDILEKHKTKLKEKIALQKLDLAQQKEKLAALGATFDAEDRISNYLDLLGNQHGVVNGLVDAYNAIVGQYNTTTDKTTKDALKDQITDAERQLKKAQDYYKDLQTAIKNYDSLKDDMEDLVDQIEEETQKQIEINIKRFRMQLEIRLDMGQAERDWNKFRRHILEGGGILDGRDSVLKDSAFDTLMRDADLNYKNIESYFNVHGNNRGEIQTLTDQLEGTLAQLEQLDKAGDSAIYGDRKKQLLDDLQNDLTSLTGKMQDIQELINNIDEAYLDTYEDIKKQMDQQIDDYQFLDGIIEHDIDLLQLLYGDRQYEAMNSFYTQQHENQLQEIDFLHQSIDVIKERIQMEQLAGNENAVKQLKEDYKDLVNDLNSLVEASVQTLRDKYTNAINQIFDQLDKQITNGRGTEYLQMEWELMNKNADEYLDTINSAFALRELQTKFQNAIDDTKNVRNQKALTDLMNEQLDQLRAKDKLTQYDVDRAEKLLQIEQARIALEEQQKSKTSLRLRRDSQGNYSYVYAANQEQVANAEEALAKAQNDLYNFDKNAYQKNLDDILAAWRDFQSKYKDIVLDTSLTEEQRVERLALLRDQYGEYINNKIAENEVIRTNLMESAFIDYAALYDGDYNAYQAMIENEKQALMGELVPTWNSGIQQMANTFAGEGGFIPACQSKLDQLADATQRYYNQDLKNLEAAAGEDFSRIREGAINPTVESFKQLVAQNDELIAKFGEQLNAIDGLKEALNGLLASYDAVWKAADAAAQKAHDALQAQRQLAANEANANQVYQPAPAEERPQSLPTTPTSVPASVPTTSPTTSSTQASSNPTTQPGSEKSGDETFNPNSGSTAEGIAGNIYYGGSWNEFYHPGEQYRELLEEHGFINSLGMTKKKAQKLYDEVLRELGRFRIIEPGPKFKDYYLDTFDFYKMRDKYKWGIGTSGFDTGGYTGSWGPEGRLALLHQKELVLNADDTKNMLNSVSILRDIVSNVGGKISAKMSRLGGYTMPVQPKPADELQQSVNIQASFPNVNSKREIEEALNDLVNLAAQRAMKRR